MSHVQFVVEHPGVPRMMFGELQHAEATPAKAAVGTLMRLYTERLRRWLENAKRAGEVAAETDTQAAAMLLIGTVRDW